MTSTAGASAGAAIACPDCGTAIASSLTSCPACHRLVHATTLRELAERGAEAARAGDLAGELSAWRTSLELLPPESRQFRTISDRVAALSKAADAAETTIAPPPSTGAWKWLVALGPIGLILWKFKFLVVLVLTKGKLLLLGLTKSTTLFSMLLALGVYWTTWGLPFAFGFVISIYIHEMGHVAALHRFGIRASAPMFIPGVGALVRLRQSPANPYEDARVGLAGPWWGLGAAIAAYTGSLAGGGPLWAAIAKTGAWINLFNLMPIWQLDGGRGFAAMTRPDRWLAAGALAAGWMITGDGLFVLLLLVAIGQAFSGSAPTERDSGATTQYVALTIALSLVFKIAQPF
ncbi:MAG TPA: site-2 protease family protein [Vicinamibacterales bacterium]|jgi:Zn-dependent protease